MPRSSAPAVLLAALTVLMPLGAATSAVAAPARPDLVTAAVADPPRTVAAGGTLRLRDTARNAGGARAGASTTRFLLTGDVRRSLRERLRPTGDPRTADGEILLGGAREVPALAAGATSRARRATVLRVPGTTPPGRYRVLACADDRGAVRERDEARNCRASRRAVTVTGTPEGPVAAMSDVFPLPDEAADRGALAQFAATRCRATTPVRKLTLPAAIRSLRAALTRTAGADAMRAFAASPEFRDAAKAQRASVGALIAARPGASLAALLRAHELQPRRAAHLRNAASVAASMGFGSEALALLDGAARADDQPLAGMGIAPRTAALAIRGQALGMLGQWSLARPALQAALDREPLLAEAAQSLATVTACTGTVDQALVPRRRSRVRRTPVQTLDLSRGQEHPLRDFTPPTSPGQASPAKDLYLEESQSLLREQGRLNDRRTAIEANLRAEEPTATRAKLRRLDAIMDRIAGAHREADVAAAQDRVDALLEPPEQTVRDFWGNADQTHRFQQFLDVAAAECPVSPAEPYDACHLRRMQEQCIPALRSAHQTWADQVSDLWRAADAAHRLFARRVSAYGAHLSGPQATALVRLTIEEHELATYTAVRGSAIGWTVPMHASEKECVAMPEPTGPVLDTPTPAGSEACSPLAKTMNGVAKLDDFTLKVSCEGVELGGSLPAAPWLAGFAEASYDVRAGKMTLFTGAQLEVDTLQVVKGSFKSGVYLTVDMNGIQDIGWRTGPSATAGAGPVEFAVYKDEIDMSFVGAFDALTGVTPPP